MNTEIKAIIMDAHRNAIRCGKFNVAWLILNFLKNKKTSLGLGDVAFEVEQILEHAGCKPHYSRNYDIVRFYLPTSSIGATVATTATTAQ